MFWQDFSMGFAAERECSWYLTTNGLFLRHMLLRTGHSLFQKHFSASTKWKTMMYCTLGISKDLYMSYHKVVTLRGRFSVRFEVVWLFQHSGMNWLEINGISVYVQAAWGFWSSFFAFCRFHRLNILAVIIIPSCSSFKFLFSFWSCVLFTYRSVGFDGVTDGSLLDVFWMVKS